MKAVFGLGNPGKKFEQTRHNAGFMLVDKLAGNIKLLKQKKFKALVCKVKKDLLLVKPQTFMNRSGESVLAVKNFFKIKPEDILIVHDDLDFRLGEYKFSFSKSPKTHNGIASVEKKLKTDSFWRIRIGVESRTEKTIPGKDYVLKKMESKEKKLLDKTLEKIVKDLNQNL
jgi:peptidyl-tRNA hydrolase, PTH1 family